MGNINAINKESAIQVVKALAKGLPPVGFESVYQSAVAASQGMLDHDQFKLSKRKGHAHLSNPLSVSGHTEDIASIDYAQQLPGGVSGPELQADGYQLNSVPIQFFLSKASAALSNISRQEYRVNDLIKGYVDGKVLEDEVFVATAQLNLSMTMVTTIIQGAVTAFKELQNVPI